MRKLHVFLAVLFAVSFSGCAKHKPDTSAQTTKKIIAERSAKTAAQQTVSQVAEPSTFGGYRTLQNANNAAAHANFTELYNSVNSKQDALVNQTNIKSINGVSLLGSGNLTVSGGGGFSFVSADPSPIVDNTSWYRTDTGELKVATSEGVRTFTGTLAAGDYTPDAFTFTSLTSQATDGKLKCSDPVTPTGYNRETTWAIASGDTGCSVKIDGGTAATSGTIAPTQTIAACVNGSTSGSTTTTCTPIINGVSADPAFIVSTSSAGITDDFSSDTSSNYTRGHGSGSLSITSGYAHLLSSWSGRNVFYHNTSIGSSDIHAWGNIDNTNSNDNSGIAFRVDPLNKTCYVAYFISTGQLTVRGFNLPSGIWGTTELYSTNKYEIGSRLVDVNLTGTSLTVKVDGVNAITATVTEFSAGSYVGFLIYRDSGDPKIYDFNAE